MYPTRNGKSPYEKYVGIEPNTIKKLVTSRELPISESSEELKLSPSDFESGQDSTIFVRERVRGTKLENAYKKRKGTILDQSQHTITFLPAGKTQETIIFKWDIVKTNNVAEQQQYETTDEQPCSSQEADRRLIQLRKQMAEHVDVANTGELASQVELTNHSNSSLSLDKTTSNNKTDECDTERPTKQVKEPTTPTTTVLGIKQKKSAIKQLKDKVRRQQKKKKTNSLPTIQESSPVIDLTESDEEEEMMAQEEQVNIKQESQEETSPDDSNKNTTRTNLPPRRDTIQERRRGERNRQKTEFFGHNIMVTKIDGPRTEEQHEETKKSNKRENMKETKLNLKTTVPVTQTLLPVYLNTIYVNLLHDQKLLEYIY